ncbi:hypothetical protein [Desulfoscipio geothermicus]|uniref:hypothetical protein n=1 Tax=Desulfoscipio geothermicus TaxID=39060 RepID=UPI0013F4E915|nr:hypothetical protein [Desulfoscipio geothermicus]
MAGADYETPQVCIECLRCIRHYRELCPGLVVWSREGCISASKPWREKREAKSCEQ